MTQKGYRQRRVCALAGIDPRVYRRTSTSPEGAGLRARLKNLSAERRRFGYRQLQVLLRREGWSVNWKKLYRIYKEEGLTVRKHSSRPIAVTRSGARMLRCGRSLRTFAATAKSVEGRTHSLRTHRTFAVAANANAENALCASHLRQRIFGNTAHFPEPDVRHQPEELVTKLRQVEVLCGQGMSRVDAIRQVQITEQTFYHWRKQYGGLRTDQLRELKRLQKVNDRLRRAVSDLTLDKLILSEAARGNF